MFKVFVSHLLRRLRWAMFGDLFERMAAMADQLQELLDAVGRLETSVNDTTSRVQAQQANLQAIIDDLKSHPAAPDLGDIITRVQNVVTNLNTIDPSPTPATPTPVDPEPTPAPTPETPAVESAPVVEPVPADVIVTEVIPTDDQAKA